MSKENEQTHEQSQEFDYLTSKGLFARNKPGDDFNDEPDMLYDLKAAKAQLSK